MSKAEVAVNESVVAIIGTVAIDGERELAQEISGIELQAELIIIGNDVDFEEAEKFKKQLKERANKVIEHFKSMKGLAYKTHKEVCEREKDMLVPIQRAMLIVKQSMQHYELEQDKKRRVQEETLRKMAEEESKRKLEEAVAFEEEGRLDEARAAMADAEVMESAGMMVTVYAQTAKGVSISKEWEITEVRGKEVPLSFSGVELRPVDQAAVMRLIRASKGQIQIPGIGYKEKSKY